MVRLPARSLGLMRARWLNSISAWISKHSRRQEMLPEVQHICLMGQAFSTGSSSEGRICRRLFLMLSNSLTALSLK